MFILLLMVPLNNQRSSTDITAPSVTSQPTRLQFFVQEFPKYTGFRGKVALVLMVWGWEAAQWAPIDVKVVLDDFTLRHYDSRVGLLYPDKSDRSRIAARRRCGFRTLQPDK